MGAKASIALRSLLLVPSPFDGLWSFFLRLVHFAGAHRLVQRVGFQTQFISDFRDGSYGIKHFLNLSQDRRGQHRRPTTNARGEKTSHSLASIQLDAPQHN